MPVFTYRTIQAPAEGFYKEKGSKFLAFAYPVDSETIIRERLEALRKEYFDARHHCYAWMLGPERKHFRANDDGEPNHSAGDPILGQIRSKELTNILIVVVRYFGGTKLGVGGLISAYKIAAEDALNHAVMMECEVTERIVIKYEYASTPDVMKLVKDFDLKILHQDFTTGCTLEAEIKIKHHENFFEKITLMKALGASLEAATLPL
ncbi:IMPACT family protein [Ohtaekwangia sp.]|uniref:IMPACT family protein n=1 Tax=Ohtaekwangia sp. TaxID=2066019 RepID=UPI002F93F88F